MSTQHSPQQQPPAARLGNARGLRPSYIAAEDPWHVDGYITGAELGLPTRRSRLNHNCPVELHQQLPLHNQETE